MPNEDYAKTLEEAREIEEISARIPADAPNRDELINEQLVQRDEQKAAAEADGAEGEYVSDNDGAVFHTEAALQAHDDAFFPDAPKPKGKGKAKPVPIQVVETTPQGGDDEPTGDAPDEHPDEEAAPDAEPAPTEG